MKTEIMYKDLSFKVVGLCQEVHRILGRGHSEVVYKDALQYELTEARLNFSREKNHKINYNSSV